MLDDIEGLRALVAVADCGNFAAAGRALRLSTNAVSHRVAKLEAHLGVRVFDRTTRMVRATDTGERLLVRARRVLEELEQVEREATTGQLSGTVRVGLPPDLAGPVLLRSLARVLAASPSLRLEVLGRAVPVDPRREGLDLVVWGGPREKIPPDLVARDLGALEWSLCAAPSYVAGHGAPSTPEDLARHRCLLARHPEPERSWHLVDAAGREVHVEVSGAFESDHPRMLLEAMVQGLGIGIRPKLEVQEAAARGEWVHILPEWGFKPIPVALVAPRGRLRAPSVKLVAETLEAALRHVGGRV